MNLEKVKNLLISFISEKKSNKWTKKTYKQVDIQKYGAYKRENEEGKGDI